MTGPFAWSKAPVELLDALDPHAVGELHRSISYLQGGTPRCCPHTQPDRWWWLCAWHPALGLSCEACLQAHLTARHPHDLEHRCDGCGQQDETMVPFLVQVPRPRWVRPPRAAKARNGTMVLLSGIGVCRACATDLGYQVTVGRSA